MKSMLLFSLLNCAHGASRETKKSTLDPSKILSASVSMRDEQTKSGPIEVKQIGIQFDTSKSKEKIEIVQSQNKKVKNPTNCIKRRKRNKHFHYIEHESSKHGQEEEEEIWDQTK